MAYKRYHVSNAVLKATKPKFRLSSYVYSWTFNTNTLVEEYPESVPPPLQCQFQFTPFSELHKHAETETYQCKRNCSKSPL